MPRNRSLRFGIFMTSMITTSGIAVASHWKCCSNGRGNDRGYYLTVYSPRYVCAKSKQTSLPKVIWEEGCKFDVVAHVRRKVPIGYNSPPKVPLPVDRSPNRTTCLIPRPVRPTMPNGIQIRSAVFPQCTGQSDWPTHVRTDRQIVNGKVWRL